jgi:hypothetical protein
VGRRWDDLGYLKTHRIDVGRVLIVHSVPWYRLKTLMSPSYAQNLTIPVSEKVFTLIGIYHSRTLLAAYSIIYVHIVRVPVEKDKLTVMLFVYVINFYIIP